MLGLSEPKPSRYVDPEELYEQLAHLRGQLRELSEHAGKLAGSRSRQARTYAAERIDDAEEVVKDNMAASMLLALGLGLLVGYFLKGSRS